MTQYLIKKLPYNDNEPFPQRVNVKHKGNVYQVTYRRNSFNNKMILEILRMYDQKKIFAAQLNKGSTYYVTDPDTGYHYFMIFVNSAVPSTLDIWVLDDEVKML